GGVVCRVRHPNGRGEIDAQPALQFHAGRQPERARRGGGARPAVAERKANDHPNGRRAPQHPRGQAAAGA
nr:hypothetical protein [Tanacetum cinerariifolium]